MLFRVLIMIHVCAAFPFKCPEPAQWSLRARSHCPDPSKYFCLKNDLIKGYSENCTVFDFLQPGRKNVLRGGLDADICSSERYQPWPITFYTNISTNCIFLKSKCNEEGQVVYENGDRNTDSTCMCDFKAGYNFVVKPQHPCFCVPSKEDCSCYVKTCPEPTFILAPDFECIDTSVKELMTKCRPTIRERTNIDDKQSRKEYISRKDNITLPVAWKTYASIPVIVCIGWTIILCGNALLDKYYRKGYFIHQPPDEIRIYEGQSVSLKYKLLMNRFPIVFVKNKELINFEIARNGGQINEINGRNSKTLQITHVTLTDGGTYLAETTEKQSKPTELIVTPLFKKQLANSTIVEGSAAKFECETENIITPVEWFQDGKKIRHDQEKIQITTLPNCVYELNILHTTIHDGGTYRIEKNGVCSEAVLHIKALFIRPLEDVSTVETLDTIFDCKTEDIKSPVEWFKNGLPIINKTANIKMETLPGNIYRLTISYTTFEHRGTYSIKKNGVFCKAVLRVKALFVRPLKDALTVEASDTIFECKTEDINSPVEWFKDGGQRMHTTENIKIETLPGNIYRLTILHTTFQDRGTYKIEKNGVCSKADLFVKELFKQPLEDITIMEGLNTVLKCQTEDNNSSVEWLKDGNLILLDIRKIKEEALSGHIYKLTILNTSLHDSGKYSIKKSGIVSEAQLLVKEMPETIKQMSEYDREQFLKATKSGTTQRYNIRVMIVGKGQVGKTCLLRRLLNEEIDDVQRTDGLDIQRRKCRINIMTGEWDLLTSYEDSYSVWSGHNDQFADCGFWDFAGQKEFYATHQTFLSSNAVYLLVVDISEQFTEKTHKMIEEPYDSIGEYIEFWLDNIHCYSTDVHNGSSLNNTDLDLNPPVIIVCTGIDKIPMDELDGRKKNFYQYLGNIFSLNAKRRHLRKVHFLSNTSPSDNAEEFEKLRRDIFDEARVLKNWGDNIPTPWFVLEKEIYRNISEEKYTISYNEAITLAIDCSFIDLRQTTSELDSFLKYEHDIGNIIFFEDVKDFIVLDPKWLVDVFKCFVSDQHKDELINMPEWTELEKKGKLLHSLIVKLLEKAPHLIMTKHEDFVLQIMEKFDIIVRPINDAAKDVFYMPCMIEPVTLNDIIRDIGAGKWKRTSWFCVEFDFLPPSYFNHILVSFVKEKKLWTQMDNQLCIYHNIGLFQINEEFTKVLIICLSKNSIAMQVLQWNGENECYTDIKNKLIALVCSMKLRYRINITFKKKFLCSNGIYHDDKGKVDYDTVLRRSEYNCLAEKKIHRSKEIYTPWVTNEEIEDYNRKRGEKCHNCMNMSVYWCYDCSKLLCTDCCRIHDGKMKDSKHSIQHISDSYILNSRFSFANELQIKDMICLPDGLLVAVTEPSSMDLMTFSVLGQERQIPLKEFPSRIVVVDKNTVAVLLMNVRLSVAIVDIQQKHENKYIKLRNNWIDFPKAFVYIENQFYVTLNSGITVMDMSGTVKYCVKLNFTPDEICYEADSKRIYCINEDKSGLIYIDRDGNNTCIFPFNDMTMTYLHRLTIDNNGNLLMLCTKRGDNSGCVIKVDSCGKTSDVISFDLKLPLLTNRIGQCIGFYCLTNLVVIGVDGTVYLFKKD